MGTVNDNRFRVLIGTRASIQRHGFASPWHKRGGRWHTLTPRDRLSRLRRRPSIGTTHGERIPVWATRQLRSRPDGRPPWATTSSIVRATTARMAHAGAADDIDLSDAEKE